MVALWWQTHVKGRYLRGFSRELDVLVAEKVMGWTRIDSHPFPHTLLHPGIEPVSAPWFFPPGEKPKESDAM